MRSGPLAASSVLSLALLLGACASRSGDAKPGALAAYPGIQDKMMSYYDARASERDQVCNDVRMDDIIRIRIVTETAALLVLDVNYDYSSPDVGRVRGVGLPCEGFQTRTFTFAKSGGGFALTSMSGATH